MQRYFVFTLSLFLLITFAATFVQAQSKKKIQNTVKQVFNLKEKKNSEGSAVGNLSRTEYETFDVLGRRLRVEWHNAEGEVTLAFMELYKESDKPYGAVYFEGDLDPNLENFEYKSDGKLRRVTYTNAAGKITAINEFVLDENGNELERRYGNPKGEFRATDKVSYDENGNQTGYVYERKDGSRRVEYKYKYTSFDKHKNWTSRILIQNDKPLSLEIRRITYAE